MKFYKTLCIAFLALTTFSCEKDDDTTEDTVVINAPSNLLFSQSNIDVDFYTEGSTAPTSLDWGGETGEFELGSPVQGIAINSTNGTITWDKSLPIGSNDVVVVARNSAGLSSTTLQIQNTFQGFFTGGYNNAIDDPSYSTGYTMTFNDDGTMFGDDNGSTFSGMYSIDGTTVNTSYSYDQGGDFSTTGTITYDDTSIPVYQGTWGSTPSNNDGGALRLELN